MAGTSDTGGLRSWAGADVDIFQAAGRVAAHPGFAAASRALAEGMLELSADDRALDAIFKDAGRYFATMWGFVLHDGEGLTLPRLKAVCARSGLLSPGRARSLLQFLEYFGYLERGPGPRGAITYAPTPAFLAAWDRQFVTALNAARHIEPDLALVLDPANAAARATYGRIHASGLLGAMQAEPVVSAFLRVFLHPYAGSQMLWRLIAEGQDQGFPPHRAGPVSVASLARGCGVARSQIARIFREARDEGLAALDDRGIVHFHASAREQLGIFYSIQLAQIIAAASEAAQIHDLATAPALAV
jgi:hypothetical protein